jgi:hypothetical protein
MPDNGRTPASPLKSENTRFPTEGRTAVTCYSVGGTRRPASPRCSEVQHFPPCLPAGEPNLSCWRSGILAPPLSGNPLFCSYEEACLPRCPALPTVPDSERAPAPLSMIGNARFPTEGRKAIIWYSVGGQEDLNPQGAQRPSTSHSTPAGESHLSFQELESWLLHWVAICYSAGARRLASCSAQRPSIPLCDHCRVSGVQRPWTSAPSLSWEKR